MAAQPYNLEINQGATFSFALNFFDAGGSPLSLTGVTLASQIRPTAASQEILQEFTVTKDPVTTGRATFSLTAAQTRNLRFTSAVYDVLMTLTTGELVRVVQGAVTLSPQVTR
jgi:hypothetical protein